MKLLSPVAHDFFNYVIPYLLVSIEGHFANYVPSLFFIVLLHTEVA